MGRKVGIYFGVTQTTGEESFVLRPASVGNLCSPPHAAVKTE
jgi:hypothetical protein